MNSKVLRVCTVVLLGGLARCFISISLAQILPKQYVCGSQVPGTVQPVRAAEIFGASPTQIRSLPLNPGNTLKQCALIKDT